MSKFVSTWLTQCSADHPLCKQSSPPTLPLRVIDVLSRDDPFLLETDGQNGHYFALSYCWGKQRVADMMSFGANSRGRRGQPTPQSNIENHKLRISYSDMPKTLRDAVTFSRLLNNRYVWIDALCIVQGDEEEWEREHPKMAEIYSNAKLVLAADNADGLEKGFLGTNLEVSQTQEDWSSTSPAKDQTESLQRRERTLCPSPLSLDEPLNRRAWSLSEMIFANRVIHFTSSGMVWECNEVRQYESGIPYTFHENDDDSFRMIRSTTIAEQRSKEELYRKWHALVAAFTKRQINSQPGEKYKDTERLVALSRVARRISWILSEIHGSADVYLAGMWRGDLRTSLLWSVEECLQNYRPGVEWRRPETPRAPSWSWAAIEGPVSIEPLVNIQSDASIEGLVIEHLNGNDLFGRVLSGSLTVRGKVLHNLPLQLDDLDSSTYATRHLYKTFGCTVNDGCTFVLDVPLSQQELSRGFSCVFLGKGETEANLEKETREHFALLLLRAVSVAPLRFERVGISSRHSSNGSVSGLLAKMKGEMITII